MVASSSLKQSQPLCSPYTSPLAISLNPRQNRDTCRCALVLVVISLAIIVMTKWFLSLSRTLVFAFAIFVETLNPIVSLAMKRHWRHSQWCISHHLLPCNSHRSTYIACHRPGSLLCTDSRHRRPWYTIQNPPRTHYIFAASSPPRRPPFHLWEAEGSVHLEE